MTQQLSLEQQIADWMADEASGPAPEQLIHDIDTATNRARPLPRWLAVLKEPTMTTMNRTVVGVPKRPLLALAVLAILAAAAAIGAAALLLQRPSSQEDWPGYRGDASRTGLAVSGPIGHPLIRWHIHAAGAVRSAIAISGDLALFGSDDGVLHAVSVDNGAERWAVAIPGVREGPYAAGDRVYVAGGDSVVHALAREDGHELWTSGTTVPGSTYLTAVGTRLFAGTNEGSVVALDTASGRELWRTAISDAASPVHAPAASQDVVVAAADDGTFVALDPASGAIRWRVDASTRGVGNPVIAEGLAFLGGSPESTGVPLVAYSISDGKMAWRFDRNVYAPSAADGVGYTGSGAGSLASIDLETGAERWLVQFNGSVRAPVVAGDIVYVSADGEQRLVALDRATGGELWSLPLDAQNDCCVAVSRGTIFVGTLAGSVYAIGGDGTKLTANARPTLSATPAPATQATPATTAAPLETTLLWAKTSGAPDFDPWGLTLAPDGRLWVLESPEDRISIFNPDGTFVETWGESGSGDGQFDLTRGNGDPYGALAFAPDGSFYILDVGNRRVEHFTADRQFLGAWGTFGSAPGQFNDPVGIVVDDTGTVHVLDDIRNVIESYGPDGTVVGSIAAFPDGMVNDGANRLSLGPDGDFYVSMAGPIQVLELARNGSLVRIFGAPGSGDGAMDEQPNAVEFDAVGRLYVSQGRTPGGRCVNVYAADGTFIGSFGEPGGGDDQIAFPWGMLVLDDGIVISDPGKSFDGSNLLRKFSPITFP